MKIKSVDHCTSCSPYFTYILRAIVARICLYRIQEKLFRLEMSKMEEQTGVTT